MELKNLAKDVNEQLETEDEVVEEELGNVIQLVSFVLDDVEFGIDILSVVEIQKMHQIAHLPNSPDFIKGIINLRGNVIPVVDVRLRFSLDPAEPTEFSRIIVIDTNGKKIGLYVDNVRKVVRIPESNVAPPSDLITDISDEFIQGIGRMKEHLIVILKMVGITDDSTKTAAAAAVES
jgi:purine-binding chemotaxis protein CheW